MNNFGYVAYNVWRGSQPQTPFDAETLHQLGVMLTYKLSSRSEFDPAEEAKLLGMQVQQDEQDQWRPEPATVIRAVIQIHDWILDGEDAIYIHCKHGRDRTGLVVGAYRLLYSAWDIEKTLNEFHAFFPKGLPGIVDTIADHEIEECLRKIAATHP